MGEGLKKIFFWPFGPQFGPKIRGGLSSESATEGALLKKFLGSHVMFAYGKERPASNKTNCLTAIITKNKKEERGVHYSIVSIRGSSQVSQ